MRKIKAGDTVKIIAGKDLGKEGKVLKIVDTKNNRGKEVTKVLVEGVNIIKKAQKPNPSLNIIGGIIEFEKPVDISNVMYLEAGKPTRVGFTVDEKSGKKVRVSKKTGNILDK